MIRIRPFVLVLLAMVASGTLASCGKKGPLERPTATTTTTAPAPAPQTTDDEEKQDKGGTSP